MKSLMKKSPITKSTKHPMAKSSITQNSMNKIIAFMMALLLSFGFAACCLKIPALSESIASFGNINLITYALQILLFCLLFLLFYGIINWKSKGKDSKASVTALWMACLLTAVTMLFFLFMFRLEENIYGGVTNRYVWHKLPLWLVLLFLASETIIFFLCLREGQIHLPEPALYLLYGMFTILIGYTFYTPSIFVRGASDRLHAHAYYNSIYNVYHGSPYTEYTTSIYGHYAILYKLPLKILGGDFIDFILLNAILGSLCFLGMFLALHFVVKNNLLRVLGAISMTFPILSMRGGYYWQLWPHRILFMSLIICFAAFCIRFQKLNKPTCILGYILAILGILWNTESGLFCAVAWAGFWILKHLCDNRWRFVKALMTVIIHLGAVALCFFGAYGIVNAYNLVCGGTVNSIREFLFPLLTTSYMDDLLRVDLPDYPSAYMPVLALLFLAVAWGISYMGIFRKDHLRNMTAAMLPCFAFFTGVLTLGQISYFMNRASYHNLDICHLPAILLICLMAERGMAFIRAFHLRNVKTYAPSQIFQGAFTAVSLFLLLTLTTGNLVQYGYNTDLKTQFHNKQDIHDFAANVAANIPKNTYGFGIGVAEIYSMLRWNTQCYTLDFSDISVRPQVADYVIEDIRSKDLPGFLVGENTIKKLRNFSSDQNQWLEEHYQITQEFEFQGAVFQYFTKK